MSKSTIRSHYLPRTYLKHFLLKEGLFMHKKGEKFFKDSALTPEKKILYIKGVEGLKNVGLQNYLYDPEVPGISSDDLEEIFREYGENFYDSLIAEIEALPLGAVIPQEVKDKLCIFMSAMRVRTPLFKWEVEQIGGSFMKHKMARSFGGMTPEELVKFYKAEIGKEVDIKTAEKVVKSFAGKKYDLKYPNGYFIKMALMSIEQHTDIFHQMNINIYRTKNKPFITSDNPTVYFVPRERVNFYYGPKSLVSPFCELYFPLTKDMAALFTWKKQDQLLNHAPKKIVRIFNYNIAHNSLDYIFSPNKSELLEKFVEEHIPYPFKITVT